MCPKKSNQWCFVRTEQIRFETGIRSILPPFGLRCLPSRNVIREKLKVSILFESSFIGAKNISARIFAPLSNRTMEAYHKTWKCGILQNLSGRKTGLLTENHHSCTFFCLSATTTTVLKQLYPQRQLSNSSVLDDDCNSLTSSLLPNGK